MRPLPAKAVDPAAGPPREPVAVVQRFFTRRGERPLDLVDWERRIVLDGADGHAPIRHRQVELPCSWSCEAAQAFARQLSPMGGSGGQPDWSVRQVIRRVVSTLALWGRDDGHLADDEAAETFSAELAHLIVHQMLAFNVPAWLSLGVEPEPQCCSCPISSVGRTGTTAFDLAGGGELPFTHSTGTGVNLSVLPSAQEPDGSGPVSFLVGVEAWSEALRSAAGTVPPARTAVLDVDHPDIRAFVTGPAEPDGGVFPAAASRRAVRLSDAFMQSVASDSWWETLSVGTGEVVGRERSRELLGAIVARALASGQPTIQFGDTVNRWNTCAGWGTITAATPCGEHMFLDDTASQLAWLNLLRFLDGAGRFRADAFRRAVEVAVLALEILVGHTRYPRARVAARTRELRPLGLGHANLAALLMASGLPYDSDLGRTTAAAVTSLMTGAAYTQSARIAAARGSFSGYPANRLAMLDVLDRHREAAHRLPHELPLELRGPAVSVWDEAITLGTRFGFRNAQVTAVAPTGAVARLMDLASAGLQPVSTGSEHAPVGDLLALGLARLGYTASTTRPAVDELRSGSEPGSWTRVEAEHRPLFSPPTPLARLRMAAAVQPFLSGAAAADLAVPAATSPQDAQVLVVQAWKLGVKAVALRRAGGASAEDLLSAAELSCQSRHSRPPRRTLPDHHRLLTHRFTASGHEGRIAVALYPDGSPGEVTIAMAPPSSALGGPVAAFADVLTTGLQRGVPLGTVLSGLDRLRETRSSWAGPAQAAAATSILAHVAEWMAAQFLSPTADPGASRVAPARDEAGPLLPRTPPEGPAGIAH